MYTAKTKVESLDFHEDKLQINFIQKVRLIMNMCPNPQMKRFIAKGNKRLEEDMDMFCMIKQHKHHHKFLKSLDEDIIKHDTFDLDYDSVEEQKSDPKKTEQKVEKIIDSSTKK